MVHSIHIFFQVTPTNLQSIVQQLLSHLINPTTSQPSASHTLSLLSSSVSPASTAASPSSPLASPTYRHLLTHRILSLTARNGYANVEDFEWYFAVLIDLAYVSPVPGTALRDALLDVAVRVRAVRGYAAKLCARLLGDDAFVSNAASRGSPDEAGDVAGSAEVLWAAAWICGEYCRYWGVLLDVSGASFMTLFPGNYRTLRGFCHIYCNPAARCYRRRPSLSISRPHSRYSGIGLQISQTDGTRTIYQRLSRP